MATAQSSWHAKKTKNEADLRTLETKIFELETKYLSDGMGNIVTGLARFGSEQANPPEDISTPRLLSLSSVTAPTGSQPWPDELSSGLGIQPSTHQHATGSGSAHTPAAALSARSAGRKGGRTAEKQKDGYR